MKKNVLLGVFLSSTITLSAQQTSLAPQTTARLAEHKTFQTAVQEAALLEELYLAEEMAAFDLAPVPERMQPDKVAKLQETSDVDGSSTAKTPQSRQRKALPAFAHFPPLISGQRSKSLATSGNQFQTPGLLSIIPKLFLSFPRMFRMLGK